MFVIKNKAQSKSEFSVMGGIQLETRYPLNGEEGGSSSDFSGSESVGR